jgi:hypothetical protein
VKRLLALTRQATAIIASAAMLQGSAVAFTCAMNCSQMNSSRDARGAAQAIVMHHHSHAHYRLVASAGCPKTLNATRSCCSSNIQPSVLMASYSINPNSVTSAQSLSSQDARSESPSWKCLSPSPPNSLIGPVFRALRI